jgi:hypothetical protein
MDSGDEWAGRAFVQTGAGSFTAGSFAGNYGLLATGFGLPLVTGPEFDAVGPTTSDGVALVTGTFDQNVEFGAQTAGLSLTDGYTANPSGVFTGTLTGLGTTTTPSDAFTYYLVDTTLVVAIETDPNQLTLGFLELVQ